MARDSMRRRGRPVGGLFSSRRLLAMEELVTAQNNDAGARPAGSPREPGPVTSRSRSDSASWPASSTCRRRCASASLWQAISTRSCGATASSSLAHPADVAAETLDRLDAQMDGGFHRWPGHGRKRDGWELQQQRKDAVDGEQPGDARRRSPERSALARASRPARPARSSRRRRDDRSDAAAICRRGVERAEACAEHDDFGQVLPDCAASSARTSGATRSRRRTVPSGRGRRRRREDVDDAAALGEFPRQFDGIDALEAVSTSQRASSSTSMVCRRF